MSQLGSMDEVFRQKQSPHQLEGRWLSHPRMEEIKPQTAHVLGGTQRKLMAVKKGLNFERRSETG